MRASIDIPYQRGNGGEHSWTVRRDHPRYRDSSLQQHDAGNRSDDQDRWSQCQSHRSNPPKNNNATLSWYQKCNLHLVYNPALNPRAPQ